MACFVLQFFVVSRCAMILVCPLNRSPYDHKKVVRLQHWILASHWSKNIFHWDIKKCKKIIWPRWQSSVYGRFGRRNCKTIDHNFWDICSIVNPKLRKRVRIVVGAIKMHNRWSKCTGWGGLGSKRWIKTSWWHNYILNMNQNQTCT